MKTVSRTPASSCSSTLVQMRRYRAGVYPFLFPSVISSLNLPSPTQTHNTPNSRGSPSPVAQFSSNSIRYRLKKKCPQLSKPEVTAARNQNSIGDKMEKKTLGETRLSRGGQFSSGQTQRTHLVPVVLC
ncbi:Retinoic acid receptor beta [Labeo rohita]|uniref:Retinoic acid receptor beta n=1 Tax=Labeo rohita TaxID=84645 RepID=A0ABQ8LR58_LABRO|nr:Retinoic acid receptor beta [Labeo rohita]